jgi:hypothetical protein
LVVLGGRSFSPNSLELSGESLFNLLTILCLTCAAAVPNCMLCLFHFFSYVNLKSSKAEVCMHVYMCVCSCKSLPSTQGHGRTLSHVFWLGTRTRSTTKRHQRVCLPSCHQHQVTAMRSLAIPSTTTCPWRGDTAVAVHTSHDRDPART